MAASNTSMNEILASLTEIITALPANLASILSSSMPSFAGIGGGLSSPAAANFFKGLARSGQDLSKSFADLSKGFKAFKFPAWAPVKLGKSIFSGNLQGMFRQLLGTVTSKGANPLAGFGSLVNSVFKGVSSPGTMPLWSNKLALGLITSLGGTTAATWALTKTVSLLATVGFSPWGKRALTGMNLQQDFQALFGRLLHFRANAWPGIVAAAAPVAKVLKPAAIALGAAAAAITAAVGYAHKMEDWRQQVLDRVQSNKRYTPFGGDIMGAKINFDLNQMFRAQKIGVATSGSALALLKQADRMEEAWLGFDIMRADIHNKIGTFKSGWSEGFASTYLNPLSNAYNATGNWLTNTFGNWIPDAASVGRFLGRNVPILGMGMFMDAMGWNKPPAGIGAPGDAWGRFIEFGAGQHAQRPLMRIPPNRFQHP